ncbi:MAG: beta-lactamase family protein [Ruminococcaceae bacterium]|nr:beta-lactamase family protein [Oscillospiraceae bacterium]
MIFGSFLDILGGLRYNVTEYNTERSFDMNFEKLEALMDTLPVCGYPVADLSVTHHGKEVFRRMVGYADTERTVPVSENDLFWIFSCTKIATCALALKLVEEGKLSLDDEVAKYLPAYGTLFVRREGDRLSRLQSPMRIWHLFTMTAGLNYDYKTPAIKQLLQDPHATTLQLANALTEAPLDFEPGTRYKYSLCHDVLGAVIEVASGMRFADYAQKELFDPLGMTSTGFHPSPEQEKRILPLYTFESNFGRAIPASYGNTNSYRLTDCVDSGGAGIFTTTSDYKEFAATLACGGLAPNGYRFLKKETVEMMKKNYLCDAARGDFSGGRFFGYGWGLGGRVHMEPVYSKALSPVGEFGWDGAANGYLLADTDNEIGIFFNATVRSCSYGYNVIHPRIRDYVYEALTQS